MKINSMLAKLIVLCLIISVMPLKIDVKAENGKDDIKIVTQLDRESLSELDTELLNEELNEASIFSGEDEIITTVSNDSEENLTIETEVENEDVKASIELDISRETEEIVIRSEVEEAEAFQKNEYRVDVLESEGDKFIATFTDLETGEVYEVNSTELQASVVPYLVYILGGLVIKYAVKKIGSKLALKIGKKTFYQKLKKSSKSVTKTYSPVSYSVGGGNKVTFSKAKMEHILQNHHPKYWIGENRKTFFDPDFSVNDIKNIVTNVINSNKKIIKNNLEKGKKVNVFKKINGVEYQVHIGKDGYVKSAYPIGK